jgi:hypothetical protein
MKYRKVKFTRGGSEHIGRFHQFGNGPYEGCITTAIVETDKGRLVFLQLKEVKFIETPEGVPYPDDEIL